MGDEGRVRIYRAKVQTLAELRSCHGSSALGDTRPQRIKLTTGGKSEVTLEREQ